MYVNMYAIEDKTKNGKEEVMHISHMKYGSMYIYM